MAGQPLMSSRPFLSNTSVSSEGKHWRFEKDLPRRKKPAKKMQEDSNIREGRRHKESTLEKKTPLFPLEICTPVIRDKLLRNSAGSLLQQSKSQGGSHCAFLRALLLSPYNKYMRTQARARGDKRKHAQEISGNPIRASELARAATGAPPPSPPPTLLRARRPCIVESGTDINQATLRTGKKLCMRVSLHSSSCVNAYLYILTIGRTPSG